MSLAYLLLDMSAVLKCGCKRGRSKAREVEFMMLSLIVDMIDARLSSTSMVSKMMLYVMSSSYNSTLRPNIRTWQRRLDHGPGPGPEVCMTIRLRFEMT